MASDEDLEKSTKHPYPQFKTEEIKSTKHLVQENPAELTTESQVPVFDIQVLLYPAGCITGKIMAMV